MTGRDLAKARMLRSMTQKEFAKFVGISRAYLSKIEADTEAEIPYQLEFKVEKAFKDAFGFGMLDDPIQDTRILDDSTIKDASIQGYRKAKAGHAVSHNHRAHLRTLLAPALDELPEGAYELFEVEGSSMENTLTQGDRLLCKADSIDNMIDNRVYVLVLRDPTMADYRPSGIWIKRCSYRRDHGYISCRSDNKDSTEPYPTFRVKADLVAEVWYPVLKITAHMSDPNRDIYDQLDELRSRIEVLESDIE